MSSIINAPMLSHVVAQWRDLWFQCFSLVSVSWPFEFISPPCGNLALELKQLAVHTVVSRGRSCPHALSPPPSSYLQRPARRRAWTLCELSPTEATVEGDQFESLRSVWQVGGRLRRRRQRLTHCVEAAETKEKSSSCTEEWFCLFVGTPIKHTRKHRP